MVPVEADVPVGVVVREQQAMLAAERNGAVEVFLSGHGARRIVWVADEHNLRLRKHVRRDVREVRQKTVFLLHGHEVRVRAHERGAA